MEVGALQTKVGCMSLGQSHPMVAGERMRWYLITGTIAGMVTGQQSIGWNSITQLQDRPMMSGSGGTQLQNHPMPSYNTRKEANGLGTV
eukprot:scaffold253518_cov18-Tisochrysis_lutea.AAC.1